MQLNFLLLIIEFFNKIETKQVTFNLRPEQTDAIKEIKKSDYSICVAPPGFGKTLLGAKYLKLELVQH